MALAEEVLAPYRQDDIEKITIEGASLGLPARRARMFGLALHELATNAAKHGALSVTAGRVHLDWQVEDADGRVTMTWQEADGPQITPPERKGFGPGCSEMSLHRSSMGRQSLSTNPAALRYHLTFLRHET